MVEDVVYGAFEIGKRSIDHISRQQLIKLLQPDHRIPKLPLNQSNFVDILVLAVGKTKHHLW